MGQRLAAADRRATIVAAALEVFGRRAYDDVSLDEVAARAGVTKPILYRHFASKEELYVTLLDEQAHAMEQRGWAAAGGGAPSPAEVVRLIVDSLFEHLAAYPFGIRTLEFEPAASPAIAAAQERVAVYVNREALSVLLVLRPDLRTRDAAARAALEPYLAMIAGAQARAARWWLDHPDVERAAMVDRMVAFLVSVAAALEVAALPAP
jgi:AcrR family transcriptional regulator